MYTQGQMDRDTDRETHKCRETWKDRGQERYGEGAGHERHGRDGQTGRKRYRRRRGWSRKESPRRTDGGGRTRKQVRQAGVSSSRGRLAVSVVSCESVLDPMILRGPADSKKKGPTPSGRCTHKMGSCAGLVSAMFGPHSVSEN